MFIELYEKPWRIRAAVCERELLNNNFQQQTVLAVEVPAPASKISFLCYSRRSGEHRMYAWNPLAQSLPTFLLPAYQNGFSTANSRLRRTPSVFSIGPPFSPAFQGYLPSQLAPLRSPNFHQQRQDNGSSVPTTIHANVSKPAALELRTKSYKTKKPGLPSLSRCAGVWLSRGMSTAASLGSRVSGGFSG
jgi:hypothetical protein